MRLAAASGDVFDVIDAATGQTLADVVWVDDVTLEYGVFSKPYRYDWNTLQPAVDVIKVTRVTVNFASKVINVNEAPVLMASGIEVRELHACDECLQVPTCRRIDYCTRFKCGFGEARKP